MKRIIILAIAFLTSFQIASGQVSNEHLDAYLWEYPLQQGLVIEPEMMQELVAEIQRIIDSGDLFFRPLPNDFADQIWDHYFLYLEPGRILQTVALAYPYLNSATQETFRTMVSQLLDNTVHRPWAPNLLPLDAGKQRKSFAPSTLWGEGSNFGLYRPSIQNIYNIWLYTYRTQDFETIEPYYDAIRSFYLNKVGGNHDQGRLYGTMNAHIGMARLAHLFGEESHIEQARTNLSNALNFGLDMDLVDTLARRGTQGWNGAYAFAYEDRAIDWINRNYIFHNVSPEIGRYLQDYLSLETEARHSFMMNRFPMWWLREAPYFNRWTGDEGIGIPSGSFGTNVPLERWFRNVDAEILASYMVSSPVGVADSYWMEALVMAIEANAADQWVDVRTTAFELDLAGDDPPPVEYFLTFEIIGQGHVEVDGAVYTEPLLVEEGTELTLEAYPATGWQFDGWSGDLSGAASPQTIVMDGNKDVTATFSEIPPVEYFLTLEIIGQGYVEVDGAVYTEPLLLEEGTVLTLEAFPVAGSQFDGWSGDLWGAASPQTIVMDANKDVTATFSEIPPVEYFLTLEIIGHGHVEVDGAVYTDPLLVEEGTELALEAHPAAGWQFDGWSGDLLGAASPQTIVMDGNMDVTATFSEIPPVEYFLTLEIIGQGYVEVDGVVYTDPLLVEEGTVLTLEAHPAENQQFMKWLYGNQTVWIEPELLLAMPGHDIKIAAYFVDASIHQHHDINNETIADGETACFSAMVSLVVSDLLVEAGGAITLVAAKRIHINPGSHIQNGAALHAYITQSAEFCPEQMITASYETEKTNIPVYVSDRKANDFSFKIYPNPSTGLVTVEFDHAGRNEDIQIEIFSVSGGLVYTEKIGATGRHMIDLEGTQPGIYMIRLIAGDGVGYARLVLR